MKQGVSNCSKALSTGASTGKCFLHNEVILCPFTCHCHLPTRHEVIHQWLSKWVESFHWGWFWGARGLKNQRVQNNTKGAKMLNHKSVIVLTSVAYYYDLLVSCKF